MMTSKEIREHSPAWMSFTQNADRLILAGKIKASKNITPAGWTISSDPKPIPNRHYDVDFWHENHDGINGLCGTAPTREDAIKQIKEIESNFDTSTF